MSTNELRALDEDEAGVELLELLSIVASTPGFSLVITPDVKGSRDVLVGWSIALRDDRRRGTAERSSDARTILGWVESLEYVGELREELTANMLDARRTR